MKYYFVVKVRVKAWSVYTHTWYSYNAWKYVPLCTYSYSGRNKFLVNSSDVFSVGKFLLGIKYLSYVKVVDCYITNDLSYYGLFPVEFDVFPQLCEFFGLPFPFGYLVTKRKSISSGVIAFILKHIGYDV